MRGITRRVAQASTASLTVLAVLVAQLVFSTMGASAAVGTASIADAVVAESNSGSTNITFTVSQNGNPNEDCGIRVVLTHGTTVAADFTSTAAQNRTIDQNDSSITVTYAVAGDTLVEGAQTFTLTMTGRSSGSLDVCAIADGTATGTIIDNDSVNQPPVNTLASPTSISAVAGTTINLPTSFADPDVANGTLDIEVDITDFDADGGGPDGVVSPLSTIGQLRLSNANVGTDELRTQNLTASNTLFATLQVTTSINYSGTFRVVIESDDNGNTGTGGEKADTNFYTITITPAPANQPPVNTLQAPLVRTVTQGSVINLPTSFTDPDVGSGTMDIEVNIIDFDADGGGPDGVVSPLSTIGQLRLNSATVGTDELRTQNLAASNTLFATLQVALSAGYTGTFRVVIESDDNGNTGAGGEKADTDFYTITVVPPDTSLSIQDSSINEGNTGTTTDSFTITRPNVLPVTCGFQATISFEPGDTANAADFANLTPDNHFVGVVSGTGANFSIADIAGDTTVEPDETYTVTIAGRSEGATPACDINPTANTATGTILNDDTPAVPVAFTISGDGDVIEGDSGTRTMSWTISSPTAPSAPCTMNVLIRTDAPNTTATSGVDFTGSPAIDFTFAAGQSSRTFAINILGDTVDEPDDRIQVNIAGPATGTPCPLSSTIGDHNFILDDDDNDIASVVSIADTSIDEDAGTGVVLVSMTNFASRACAVSVTTTSGTATNGTDFPAINGATFNVINTASDNLPVSVTDDDDVEGAETFTITLTLLASSDDQCQLGDNQATITITDNDIASVVSIADTSIDEDAGTGVVLVSMTNFASRACAVSVTTTSGTATNGTDFPAINGATFNVINTASDNLPVSVTDDDDVEGAETFTITLTLLASSDDQCQLGDNQATITITDNDIASVVSIADTSIDEDAGTGVVLVSMTNFASRACAVSVTTTSGTATNGTDFPAINGATFNVINTASDNLPVSVTDDDDVEGAETFTITLTLLASSDDQCQLGDNQATITITDNDIASVVSIADTSIDEDAGTGVVLVSMTNFASRACAVSVTTTSGTATNGTDFPAINGATFNVINTASDNLPVSVTDDDDVEGAETFTITLTLLASSDDQCQLGDNQATITITDNDIASVVSIADTSIDEDAGTGVVLVSMTNFASRACAVSVTTTSGTATNGTDFPAINGATFNVINTASDNLPVSVTDDDDVEGAETFTITLTLLASSDDQCQLGDNQATITITDNDIASVVSISGGSVTEGGQLVFTVSRTNGTGTCTVFAETANGTATSPGDFTFGNVTIQFNPGETSIGVLVNTIDDTVDEPDETIFLNLTNPTGGCEIAESSATGTILDNDEPPPPAGAFSVNDASATEGSAIPFVVTRTNGNGTCSITVTTADGTATSPADYPGGTTTLTFNPGVTSRNIPPITTDDVIDEPDETIFLNLTNPTGGCTIAGNQGIGTILDNDEPPPPAGAFSVSDASGVEGQPISFGVTRSTGAGDCSVTAQIVGGSATAPDDFAPTTWTFTLGDGTTLIGLVLPTVDDPTHEGPETVIVELSNPTGGCTIADGTGTITILDNDDPPPPREVCVALDQVKLQAYLQTSGPIQPVNLTGGTYNVTLTSSDPTHPDSGEFEQHTEQWYVELFDTSGNVVATSGTIGDLPAIDFTMTQGVGTITIPDGVTVTGIRAVHAFPTAAYSQSVYATLACLQLIGNQPEDDI